MCSSIFALAALTACGNVSPAASPTARLAVCLQVGACEPGPAAPLAATGRYYYVSTRGSDANPGTQALPFRTIGKAAGLALAGDAVLIQAGTYYEDVKPSHSGEPGKYITYSADGSGEVIIDAQDGRRGACIEIDNQGYLRFIGLTVRGANSYATWPRAGIAITDGAHHIVLDNITAYDNYSGIMAHGQDQPVSFVTVENSRTFQPGGAAGNLHYGIFFYQQVYDSSIRNNHVAFTLPESQSYGIEISTDYPGTRSEGARRIVVTGNEVDHNESQGIHIWNAANVLISGNHLHENGATGIQVEDGSENIVVERNLSENNAQAYEFEAGAWIDNSKNVLVRNNILRTNKVGLIITGSDRVIVHDNLVYLNNRGAGNLANAAGLIVEDSASNITLTQNTFYGNGAGGTEHGAVNFGLFHATCANIAFENNIVAGTASDFDLLQDSCSTFVSDFNDFYNARPLAVSWDQNRTDWATYLAATGQDTHSLSLDPLFTDPSAFDLSLQDMSPLIGKGTPLARTVSSGSGTRLVVTDASFFSDGFGIGSGDSITVGSHRVTVLSIDYANNSMEIDHLIQWSKGDAVSFPFAGSAPDLGAGALQ